MDHERMGRVGEQPARSLLPPTAAGKRQLQSETERWNEMTAVIAGILKQRRRSYESLVSNSLMDQQRRCEALAWNVRWTRRCAFTSRLMQQN